MGGAGAKVVMGGAGARESIVCANVQMVDAVLETHDFMAFWFPQDQQSTEHASSNLQFN